MFLLEEMGMMPENGTEFSDALYKHHILRTLEYMHIKCGVKEFNSLNQKGEDNLLIYPSIELYIEGVGILTFRPIKRVSP